MVPVLRHFETNLRRERLFVGLEKPSTYYRRLALTANILNGKQYRNIEVYIHDNPVAAATDKCPGGPFLDRSNNSSFTSTTWIGDNGGYSASIETYTNDSRFNHGFELWCNKQGRYTTIKADLSQLLHGGGVKEASVCNVGIMGTKYTRSTLPPRTASVVEN